MKLLMITILAVVLSGCQFISSESGGYNDPDTKIVEPDAASRIESAGADIRFYEFTPQTAVNMQCVFAAAERKGGLFCFPKPK